MAKMETKDKRASRERASWDLLALPAAAVGKAATLLGRRAIEARTASLGFRDKKERKATLEKGLRVKRDKREKMARMEFTPHSLLTSKSSLPMRKSNNRNQDHPVPLVLLVLPVLPDLRVQHQVAMEPAIKDRKDRQ